MSPNRRSKWLINYWVPDKNNKDQIQPRVNKLMNLEMNKYCMNLSENQWMGQPCVEDTGVAAARPLEESCRVTMAGRLCCSLTSEMDMYVYISLYNYW